MKTWATGRTRRASGWRAGGGRGGPQGGRPGDRHRAAGRAGATEAAATEGEVVVRRVTKHGYDLSKSNSVRYLERGKRHNLTKARADATRAAEFRIRLQCRKPFGGECTSAACCLTGLGAFPRRRGNDTLTYWSPLVPAKGMVGRPESLPTHYRGEDTLHVSQPVSTVRDWR